MLNKGGIAMEKAINNNFFLKSIFLRYRLVIDSSGSNIGQDQKIHHNGT
jgi:hypothetical protein